MGIIKIQEVVFLIPMIKITAINEKIAKLKTAGI